MATGYGIEAWCGDGLVTGRYSTGTMTVALALYRRLVTPRGTLLGVSDEDEEANYGFDVSSYVGKVGYATAINALPGIIGGELEKDERVRSVVVTVTTTTGEDGLMDLLIECAVLLKADNEDFTLTLAVDDVTAELTGVTFDEAA